MPSFSYNLQYAHFEPDQTEERGSAIPRDILAAFDAFDWAGQVGEANQYQSCSPTIGVKNLDAGSELGVSAVGDSASYEFLVFYFYRGLKSSFFGLRNRPATLSAPNVQVSLDEARKILCLFLDGHHEEVLARCEAAA